MSCNGRTIYHGFLVGLRAAPNACPRLPILSEGAGIVSTARVEGPPLYRGASASTETSQLPRLPPSQGARSGSTGPTWVPFPSFPVIFPHFAPKGSGQGCPSLRASDEHILIVRVLRARRAPGCSPPILPLTEPPPPGYDSGYLVRPMSDRLLEVENLCSPATIIYSKE